MSIRSCGLRLELYFCDLAQRVVDPALPAGAGGLEVIQDIGAEAQRNGDLGRGFLRAAPCDACEDFRRYLGRREVECEPAGSGNEYRCRVDDQDLSRVVLFNGGGRASANATPELRALDQQARSTRVGIWRGGDGDDD